MKHSVRSAGRLAGPGPDTNRRAGATGCRNGAPSREDATGQRALCREGPRQGRSPSGRHRVEGLASGSAVEGIERSWRSSHQRRGPPSPQTSCRTGTSRRADRTSARAVESHTRRRDASLSRTLRVKTHLSHRDRARPRTMNASPVSANTMKADTADTNVSPST